MSNTNFGKNVLTNNFDPAMLDGWGVRPSDWNLGVSIAAAARPGVVARRHVHPALVPAGSSVADNLALQPSDLTPFSIVAPVDPRLPGGGGYVVSGLYDVVPEKAGQVDNLVTDAAQYGTWSQYFNGIDVTVNVRAGRRFAFVGGTSTGQTVADNCDVRAQSAGARHHDDGHERRSARAWIGSAVTPVSPYCHVAFGVLTQLRGLSSYTVPKVDVAAGGDVPEQAGSDARGQLRRAERASSRRRSAGTSRATRANVTVNLVAPGTMYGDRINQLDLRVRQDAEDSAARTRRSRSTSTTRSTRARC